MNSVYNFTIPVKCIHLCSLLYGKLQLTPRPNLLFKNLLLERVVTHCTVYSASVLCPGGLGSSGMFSVSRGWPCCTFHSAVCCLVFRVRTKNFLGAKFHPIHLNGWLVHEECLVLNAWKLFLCHRRNQMRLRLKEKSSCRKKCG